MQPKIEGTFKFPGSRWIEVFLISATVTPHQRRLNRLHSLEPAGGSGVLRRGRVRSGRWRGAEWRRRRGAGLWGRALRRGGREAGLWGRALGGRGVGARARRWAQGGGGRGVGLGGWGGACPWRSGFCGDAFGGVSEVLEARVLGDALHVPGGVPLRGQTCTAFTVQSM